MLHKIITTNEGERFCNFSNPDGKAWIIPVKNMRVALNLYQPSGIKGKLLKALLPLLHWMAPVKKAINGKEVRCALQNELHSKLCDIFGCEDIEYSIFCGTPSVHQKTTIQLSRGKEILGYCKATDSDDIMALFKKESDTLAHLHKQGVEDIPRPLFCGTLSNGLHIFVQSTKKSTRSLVVHRWGALQEEFLATLYKKTVTKTAFDDSDYCRSLLALQEHIAWLPCSVDREKIAGITAGELARNSSKDVEYSAFHGDFTPWNMFVESGGLFVFDFEYAALTYPPGLDRYHFEMQTAIYEKHLDANGIIALLQQCEWCDKESLRCYLLDIISRFTMREKGPVQGAAAQPIELWCYILMNAAL